MSDQAPAAVSVRGISKRFGAVLALDRTDLDIRRGEFFSLLGPSGCGKTTLLRIIGGFEAPSTGALWMDGRDVTSAPPYRRRSNMIFQHLALFPHLSVARNIAFGLEMRKVSRQEIRRKVDAALALVRLEDFQARRIDALSGGQRQRVAMARALVNQPDVLLLDEPLGALDLQLRLRMQEELRRLHRETGGTFIFVTHDQSEAITLSDRIAVMRAGQILQVGTPREIYEAPRHRFVAEFMGHSNFLSGTAKPEGLLVGDVLLPGRLSATPGSAVSVALRYERIELRPAGAGGLAGTLVAEDYLGATLRRTVALSGGMQLLADAMAASTVPLVPGQAVSLSWAPEAMVLLTD